MDRYNNHINIDDIMCRSNNRINIDKYQDGYTLPSSERERNSGEWTFDNLKMGEKLFWCNFVHTRQPVLWKYIGSPFI